MTDEQRVTQLVRSFAAQVRPDDRRAAAIGAAAALRAVIDGASVADAYAAGRRAIRSSPHPAAGGPGLRVGLAS